jgi:nitrogen fixation/metabolism regulation signal transduction histidine kinase
MVFMSTAPMVFERNMMDSRMDGEAYRNIMLLTSRYYIQKESVAQNKFYSMYAPLVGEDGNIIAIICAPYTDDTYDFETNAVNHGISILSIFIFLLLFAILMTRRVLDGMFLPLLQIGRKMEDANLDSLEYIQYDKEDEISSLVNAYNRMVTELLESSRQLAEAERDKAWSGMARQVAHEIKNPLTPMKLQIQRIMRLKDKGDYAWKEKFDEVSKMLLDHINILTETANEFSTFAKLYTEEPTEINIGELIKEELAMFSGHEDITFDYIGLDDAVVMAPKPQLARVFVNLINNAVQALDELDGGRVMVSLRHSVKDGYYDIVFEDNGPGVLPENTDKLFTPNFTTKTGGSGLGLAISRSILQKCGASINYSKSFALGGACFTILYPKNK